MFMTSDGTRMCSSWHFQTGILLHKYGCSTTKGVETVSVTIALEFMPHALIPLPPLCYRTPWKVDAKILLVQNCVVFHDKLVVKFSKQQVSAVHCGTTVIVLIIGFSFARMCCTICGYNVRTMTAVLTSIAHCATNTQHVKEYVYGV